MARTTVTHIIDDLDGSKDAEEVSFGFEGYNYTIDLSKKNRVALERALRPYLEAGTKVPRGARRPAAPSRNKRDLTAVRAWAKKEGIAVSDRGRIAATVIEQYDTSH